jgi:hypothetical protein
VRDIQDVLIKAKKILRSGPSQIDAPIFAEELIRTARQSA